MRNTALSVVATLVLTASTLTTSAATNYWDNNGTTVGFGAAGGTWGTEQKWSGDSTGVAAPGTTTTTTSDDLHFGTGVDGLSTGTITVDGTAQGFGGILFGGASGEIALSGGTLNLAAVSSIRANNASNTIGSVLAGASALEVNPGDMHYGAFLPATPTLVTVFPNARLANYRGADGIMGGGAITGGARPAQAYFFRNDGSTCTFQLQQILDTPWTKCVKVELTQVGADIQGRALYAKYVNNGGVLGYDFDTQSSTGGSIATSYGTGGYGCAETWLTTAANHLLFLTTTPTTVAAGAQLADVTGVDGAIGGGSVGSVGGGRIEGTPFFFSNDGSTATYQLQIIDGNWTKCTKVELTQSGPDIQGRVLYAKYTNNGQVLGYDFDSGGNNQTIATSYTAGGYGCAETVVFFDNEAATITLTGVNTYSGATRIGGGTLELGGAGQLGGGAYPSSIYNEGRLLYNSAADQILGGAISGTGSLEVDGTSDSHLSLTRAGYMPTTSTLLFSGATLSDYPFVSGHLGGPSVNGGNPLPGLVYDYTSDGTTATFQLQVKDGGWIKCTKIELTQVGGDIYGRRLYAKYVGGTLPYPDFDTSGTSFGYEALDVTIASTPALILSEPNTYSGGTTVTGGTLKAMIDAAALPSSGGITVGNGGTLFLGVNSGLNAENLGGVGNGNTITVNNGGTLTLASPWNAGQSRPIIVNGGTMAVNALTYACNLGLHNGAQCTGSYPTRVGYKVNGVITVSGSSPSLIANGLMLVKNDATTFTLDVEDVTGDAAVDLTISGAISELSGGYAGLPLIKTGAGTVLISGANTYSGITTISDGTLALGADHAMAVANNLVLNGGALDMGDFNNTLGTLTVDADSELHLGSGQLAFADCSGLTWSGHLTLVGTLNATTLRFGNDESDLTPAQLQSISIDGNPVGIDQNGYLTKASNGSLFILK